MTWVSSLSHEMMVYNGLKGDTHSQNLLDRQRNIGHLLSQQDLLSYSTPLHRKQHGLLPHLQHTCSRSLYQHMCEFNSMAAGHSYPSRMKGLLTRISPRDPSESFTLTPRNGVPIKPYILLVRCKLIGRIQNVAIGWDLTIACWPSCVMITGLPSSVPA
jgi:hypothetical protein